MLVLIKASQIDYLTPVLTQSVGYHPNLNMGFNPYVSPVYGYGLGLPFGSYGYSIVRNPKLAIAAMGTHQFNPNTWLGKLHANTFLKKSHPFSLYPYYGSLKNKLTLLKHPEYSFTPYGLDYGYGKHYGSAMLPNNPYISPYQDFYHGESTMTKPSLGNPPKQQFYEPDNYAQPSEQIAGTPLVKLNSIIKPLVKTGVILTTAAILGKKAFESPLRLNPAGMIGRPDQ